MATMAAAVTTLGRLTTAQEVASLRSCPSSSPLLCAAFSHSKFAHGATAVIGPCWRGEQPGRKWEQVLRQSSRGSSRGGALLCMSSISLGTKETATSSDSLFSNYKPSTAFLFPGQGAQAVGMGKDAHTVHAAAALFAKANEILGLRL